MSEGISLEQAMGYKRDLEIIIKKAINDFEERTELSVTDISMRTGPIGLVNLWVEVKL